LIVSTPVVYGVHVDVGVRELRRRLAELLERAARGEVIRVTDRGVPKAVLGPVPGRDRLEEGIAAGWIVPGSGGPVARVRRIRSTRRIQDVLDDDRGE
jgi:prevent-host-death family protein